MAENYNRIQEYLEGAMSAEESREFEKELKKDPQLKEDYELVAEMEEELGNTEVDVFRDSLKEAIEEEKEGRVVSMWRRKLVQFSAVASVLLLIFVAFGQFQKYQQAGQKDSLADISEKYFFAYPKPPVRGENNKNMGFFFEDYENKSFSSAKQIARNNKLEVPSFYLGVIELGLNNPDEALRLFNENDGGIFYPSNFTLSGDSNIDNEHSYYIGLSYLAKGDKKTAISYLEKINGSNPTLYNKAQNILLELNVPASPSIQEKDS